jgi:hypothetical protein
MMEQRVFPEKGKDLGGNGSVEGELRGSLEIPREGTGDNDLSSFYEYRERGKDDLFMKNRERGGRNRFKRDPLKNCGDPPQRGFSPAFFP